MRSSEEGLTFVMWIRAATGVTPEDMPSIFSCLHHDPRRIGPLRRKGTGAKCPRMSHLSAFHPPAEGRILDIYNVRFCSLMG